MGTDFWRKPTENHNPARKISDSACWSKAWQYRLVQSRLKPALRGIFTSESQLKLVKNNHRPKQSNQFPFSFFQIPNTTSLLGSRDISAQYVDSNSGSSSKSQSISRT